MVDGDFDVVVVVVVVVVVIVNMFRVESVFRESKTSYEECFFSLCLRQERQKNFSLWIKTKWIKRERKKKHLLPPGEKDAPKSFSGRTRTTKRGEDDHAQT